MLSPLVEKAVELSAQWHDGTYRKFRWRKKPFRLPHGRSVKVPVSAHTTMVGLLVARAGWNDITVAAAFLHDILEDRNAAHAHMSRNELTKLMGEDVTRLVEEVTERKRNAVGLPRSWEVRKEDYVEVLQKGSTAAMAISLADKLHNLWTMNQTMAGGIDPFKQGRNRTALSRGPEAQEHFFEAVLAASEHHDDPRIAPVRAAVREELETFRRLVATL